MLVGGQAPLKDGVACVPGQLLGYPDRAANLTFCATGAGPDLPFQICATVTVRLRACLPGERIALVPALPGTGVCEPCTQDQLQPRTSLSANSLACVDCDVDSGSYSCVNSIW